MYIPEYFEIKDIAVVEKFINENGFATLISAGGEYPAATHIPLLLCKNREGKDVLQGHLSKANPQWKLFKNNPAVLAVFLSPVHQYISSSWYGQPNAPTWNYLSVHVSGTVNIIEGEELRGAISKLTDKYEAHSANPVSLESLPEKVQKMMQGIIGFEIAIHKIEAAFKLSQNRNTDDYTNIIKELKKTGDTQALLMAEIMERNRKQN